MGHKEWEEGRLRWKERELARLERALADAKAHGTPEEVAALEFEVLTSGSAASRARRSNTSSVSRWGVRLGLPRDTCGTSWGWPTCS
jgi:hypothetical protein